MKSDINRRLVFKALILFLFINIGFAIIDPPIYKVSIYNTIFPAESDFHFRMTQGCIASWWTIWISW